MKNEMHNPFCWKLAAHISFETMIGLKIELVFVFIIYFLNFPFQAMGIFD